MEYNRKCFANLSKKEIRDKRLYWFDSSYKNVKLEAEDEDGVMQKLRKRTQQLNIKNKRRAKRNTDSTSK